MAGYSGTPLWRKLGFAPTTTAELLHAPDGWRVPDVPDGVIWLPTTSHDTSDTGETSDDPTVPAEPRVLPSLIMAFYSDPADFVSELDLLAARIRPAGMLWIAWPRKATGHVSEMTDNLIRDTALEKGLVDVKVAAIDDAWSGLKLVWRRELR